ncbi:hypothetical protein DFH09DRAFT_1132458 [Mycena vulgaris]|nr:hypothetical protein DFH09DRAFT_1132458 [Mycena vulgaris]
MRMRTRIAPHRSRIALRRTSAATPSRSRWSRGKSKRMWMLPRARRLMITTPRFRGGADMSLSDEDVDVQPDADVESEQEQDDAPSVLFSVHAGLYARPFLSAEDAVDADDAEEDSYSDHASLLDGERVLESVLGSPPLVLFSAVTTARFDAGPRYRYVIHCSIILPARANAFSFFPSRSRHTTARGKARGVHTCVCISTRCM